MFGRIAGGKLRLILERIPGGTLGRISEGVFRKILRGAHGNISGEILERIPSRDQLQKHVLLHSENSHYPCLDTCESFLQMFEEI